MPGTGARPAARVGRHISGVWLVQVLTIGLQFAYAAFTARLISPAGFGAYAVSLAIYALVGLVAGLGLGNAAARRLSDDVTGDRRLVMLAGWSGLLCAIATVLLAGPLARLWGDPSAALLIELIAVAVLTLPVTTVLGGVLRRHARIREFALGTLVGSAIGMVVAAAAAWVWREAWTLTVTPVLTQVVMLVWFIRWEPQRSRPVRSLRGVGDDVRFGIKSMLTSALSQFPYYVPMWALSRSAGAVVFGSWNRAVVIGQLPLESATRSAVTVVYPKFRTATDEPVASRRIWTDMLAGAAIVVLPLSGLIIPVLPAVTGILLGPAWPLVGEMAIWLWAIAAATVLRTLLAAALESSDNYPKLWLSQIALAVVYLLGAWAVLATSDWVWLAVALLAATLITHAGQLLAAHDLVSVRDVLAWYAAALVCGLVLAGLSTAVAGLPDVSAVIVAGLLCIGYLALMWASRRRLRPLQRLLDIT